MDDKFVDNLGNDPSQNYSVLCSPKYSNFEDVHGYCHMFVSGTMEPLACSPNEIIFWLHHCFIDFLYQFFVYKHPMSHERRAFYPSWPEIDPTMTYDAPLKPFNQWDPALTCGKRFDEQYDKYQKYIEAPRKCFMDIDCGSPSLWCSWCNGGYRCCSKVKAGGNCNGLPSRACFADGACTAQSKTMQCVAATNTTTPKYCTCLPPPKS